MLSSEGALGFVGAVGPTTGFNIIGFSLVSSSEAKENPTLNIASSRAMKMRLVKIAVIHLDFNVVYMTAKLRWEDRCCQKIVRHASVLDAL